VRQSETRAWLGALAAASLLALLLYAPSATGPFVGDDYGYVLHNEYIHDLSGDSLGELLDPRGAAAAYLTNYSPLAQLAHALQWQWFGTETVGYHLTNVLLHAGTSVLLAALYLAWGLPRAAAWILAAIFLVHPANVEAVAWIFQLKTICALALSLGALLLMKRHPAGSLALFTAALLTKISAVAVLPAAILRTLASDERKRSRSLWLLGWVGIAVLCSIPQQWAFSHGGSANVFQPYADVGEHFRTIVAIAGRYLALAFTGFGASAFHQIPPSSAWTEPWFLFGVFGLGAIGARAVVVFRRPGAEAAFWGFAAAGWLPTSQVVPFVFSMGDRYLYFVLPGLLGATFLAAQAAAQRLAGAGSQRWARPLRALPTVAGAFLVVALGAQAAVRIPLWSSELRLELDAAKNYPEGSVGLVLRARRAAGDQDPELGVALLERLADTGYDTFLPLLRDPGLAPLRSHPGFEAAMSRVAGNWIVAVAGRDPLIQPELRMLGLARWARREREDAIAAYRRGLGVGGPLDEAIRAELAQVEAGRALY